MGYVKTTIVFIITKLLLLSFSFGSKEKKKGGASLFLTMTCHCLRILKRKRRFCFCYWSHWERILPGSTNLVIFEGQSCLRFGPISWTVWLDWKYGWTFFPLCLRSEDDCERRSRLICDVFFGTWFFQWKKRKEQW
jgi:hypothetical protein